MNCCYVANIALSLLRAAVARHEARVLDRHDRLDHMGAVNPAEAACYDLYIPMAVTLFPRE